MANDGGDEWSSNSSVPSSKKRKRAYERDDNDETLSSPLSSLSANNLSQGHLPLPASPYFSQFEKSDSTSHPHITSHTHFRSTFPIPKRLHHTSSPRQSPPPSHDHHQSSLGPHHHQPNSCSNPSKPVSPNLSCCNTCHRRPTTVQDLPTYTDCEACGSRTCYICIRTCEGPRCYRNSAASGGGILDDGASFSAPSNNTSFITSYNNEKKGRNVCGKCCVEVGVEGTVWCLVCYGDDEDGDGGGKLQGRDKKELLSTRVEKVSDWLRSCGGGRE